MYFFSLNEILFSCKKRYKFQVHLGHCFQDIVRLCDASLKPGELSLEKVHKIPLQYKFFSSNI